jgi:hypothetical protein
MSELPDAHPRPDERHEDFNALRTVISTGIKIIVPLMVAGVGVLVANHFGQKALTEETAKMSEEIKEMRAEFKITNEKVSIMWYRGQWGTAHGTGEEKR